MFLLLSNSLSSKCIFELLWREFKEKVFSQYVRVISFDNMTIFRNRFNGLLHFLIELMNKIGVLFSDHLEVVLCPVAPVVPAVV